MAKLTTRTLASGVTASDLIHIVIPSDLSQDPAGSSYKASIQQVFDAYPYVTFTGGTYNSGTGTITITNNTGGTVSITGVTSGGSSVFTGGTVNGPTNFTNGLTANTISATTYYNLPGSSSGNCFVDFYVRNVHGCSPISIWDETQTNGSNAYGTLSFSLGNVSKTYGNYSHANGTLTETGSNNGYLLTGCAAGICTLDSSYNDVSLNFTTGTTSFVFFDDTIYSSLYPSSVFTVSAVTFNGTNTVVYLYDTSVDTLGDNAIMSDTSAPTLWGGDQVFGGLNANASGVRTQAIGHGSTTKGTGSYSIGGFSSSEGSSYSYGGYSHAEGYFTSSSGNYSHSEGSGTNATGIGAHAEGGSTTASGNFSHSEGSGSLASGMFSHAEGSSQATNVFAHAEGDFTIASGQYSHSQNKGTLASGDNSHAGGVGTVSYGIVSFAHGDNNESNGPLSVSIGGMNNIVQSGDTDGSAILGGYENRISGSSPSSNVKHSAIIGGSGNTVSASGSVILGGTGLTATNSNTVYVPNFVITKNYTPTSSADTAGEPGSITWDSTYLYYKTNTGWKRLNGSTF